MIIFTPNSVIKSADVNLNFADSVDVTKHTNLYKMRAYQNGALNTGNGAFAKITLDAENYDTNNNFTGGTYTVPITGYYSIKGEVQLTDGTGRCLASIYVNGAIAHRGSDATGWGSSVATDLYLTAGNTVELYVYTSGVKDVYTGTSNTSMSIRYVSA